MGYWNRKAMRNSLDARQSAQRAHDAGALVAINKMRTMHGAMCTLQDCVAELTRQKYPTPRGYGKWTRAAVSRISKRAGIEWSRKTLWQRLDESVPGNNQETEK